MSKHLFILSPSSSGSTLLWALLTTSPGIGYMPAEGQFIAREFLGSRDRKERWNPNKEINWEGVKKIWNSRWDLSKPILLDKSPPHSVRWKQLKDNFADSHFICLMRHPYYFCEGVRRKRNMRLVHSVNLWKLVAHNLIQCIESDKSRAHIIRYEDMTEDLPGTMKKLIQFMPEIESIDYKRDFMIQKRTRPISNMNLLYDKNLSKRDKRILNDLLRKSDSLLEYFNYELER